MLTRDESIEILKIVWLGDNITQQRLAKNIGISRVTLSRFMIDRERKFSFKTLLKIERFVMNYKRENA